MTGISAVLDHILGAADTIAYFFWELLRLPLPGADTLIQWGAASFLLVLIVLAVRALLRSRLSCRACYALWALVLIRLLLPFQLSLPLPWSTADLSSAPPDDFWETSVPVFYTGTTPFEDAHPYHQGVEPGYLGPSAGSSGYIHRSDDGTTLSYYWDFYTPAQCLQALWAVGALATALLLFRSSRPFFRMLHSHYKVLSLPECPVPVYEVEGLSSPCLVGPLFPALYLPPEMADSPALPHVLAHELTHLRHGDHLWGFLRCLCLVLHWYDPLVWLAAALSKRDSELACDEGAVARLGEEERLAYGRTLVDMAARRSQCPGSLFRCSTAMAEGRKAIQQRVARLVKGTRPQKAALAAAAALLALAAVLTFGSGAPSPYSYAGYAAAVEGARSIRLAAPPLSSAGYPAIEEEAALEEARSLLLQAEEYDGSGDATDFGFSDVAPYSYQLILPVREDWMYFYLYPFSGGPVYVLPYLDGTASGAVPVATLPSGTIPQLLQLSAFQTQGELLSAIRQADAVQCYKGLAYSSTAPDISSPEAREQLVRLLSGGGRPTGSVDFAPETTPFFRISGGPGDGAVFYLAEQERNCCLLLAQESDSLPLALLPSGTSQWVWELSWLQDLPAAVAQAHSFVAYFGSLTGRYAAIHDADLVEEVRQLLASGDPQEGTLAPTELYYGSCLIFCGEGGGELGRLSLSSREMCRALVQICDRQEDRDRGA